MVLFCRSIQSLMKPYNRVRAMRASANHAKWIFTVLVLTLSLFANAQVKKPSVIKTTEGVTVSKADTSLAAKEKMMQQGFRLDGARGSFELLLSYLQTAPLPENSTPNQRKFLISWVQNRAQPRPTDKSNNPKDSVSGPSVKP